MGRVVYNNKTSLRFGPPSRGERERESRRRGRNPTAGVVQVYDLDDVGSPMTDYSVRVINCWAFMTFVLMFHKLAVYFAPMT